MGHSTRHYWIAAIGVSLLAGCSRLEQEFAIREGEGLARYLAEPVSEADVSEALMRKGKVEFPARLAVHELVYRETARDPESNRYVDPLLERLSGRRERFESVVRITPFLLSGPPELLRLRHAAARSQSDLLLVTEVARRVSVRPSPLVFFNLLLFGLFLPSQTVEVEVRIQGHLIDTESGNFIGTYRGEASGDDFVPWLSVEESLENMTRALSAEAYGRVADDLDSRLALP